MEVSTNHNTATRTSGFPKTRFRRAIGLPSFRRRMLSATKLLSFLFLIRVIGAEEVQVSDEVRFGFIMRSR
jgi:hypothetical protein